MIPPLIALQRRFAAAGHITWIGLRPVRKGDMIHVDAADLHETGLHGDHGRAGKRAVTLIQAEHLPVIAAMIRQEVVEPDVLRRNIVVSGINLSAMRGMELTLGSARIEITGPCAPCSRMEAALGPGGYTALRGHGGWCARVLTPGRVEIGFAVTPDV